MEGRNSLIPEITWDGRDNAMCYTKTYTVPVVLKTIQRKITSLVLHDIKIIILTRWIQLKNIKPVIKLKEN